MEETKYFVISEHILTGSVRIASKVWSASEDGKAKAIAFYEGLAHNSR